METVQDKHWYVIHTYSGQEDRVRRNLEHRIETMDMKDKIFQVIVPEGTEIEIHGGQRRQVKRKLFPGYVLVEMMLSNDSWYVVRNTPGVTGFVGTREEPTALDDSEVENIINRMSSEAPRVKAGFSKGEPVRIVDGPFTDFVGSLDEIDLERGKVKVLVSIFGRETPVELDLLQIQRL